MLLTAILFVVSAHAAPPTAPDLVAAELKRATQHWAGDPLAPHYVAVQLTEIDGIDLRARAGTLSRSYAGRRRLLDVDLRVGTPALDSTHPLRGLSSWEADSRNQVRLPIDDGWPLAISVSYELDRAWRAARESFVILQANRNVLAEEEHLAPDFEPRDGIVAARPVAAITIDADAWTPTLLAVSEVLDRSSVVVESTVSLDVSTETKHFFDTEGARLSHGITLTRLGISASTVADDGDELSVYHAYDVHDPASLPDAGALVQMAHTLVARLQALRDAPRGEPYSGPVLLDGRAAAVFFHEVLGHRVEGHRQKRDSEGKTFARLVGEPVLPTWLSVVDDPTVANLGGVDLRGHYHFDDEGVPSQPATIVENGIFQGFLMNRSPLVDVTTSNGHGRRSPGRAPLPRMGNTIVTATKTVPVARLRDQLLREIRSQGLPYGYIVEEIDGGFTLTGRVMPNAFNVRATLSKRVYADGRPDEIVRGVDLVGTPLVAFGQILAAGDDMQVFNGTCGAESGWVPVSGVAPSMLIRKLEFQLKERGENRPPLLAKPEAPTDDGAADARPLHRTHLAPTHDGDAQ